MNAECVCADQGEVVVSTSDTEGVVNLRVNDDTWGRTAEIALNSAQVDELIDALRDVRSAQLLD